MATVVGREYSASSSSSEGEPVAQPPSAVKTVDAKENDLQQRNTNASDPEGQVAQAAENDAFGNEDGAEIHYKTCKW